MIVGSQQDEIGGSLVNEDLSPPSAKQADASLLIDVARAVLSRNRGERWIVRPTDGWCYVQPPEYPPRIQGWKLHVSATPLSAPLVLARSAEILIRAGCSFKFGTDLRRVVQLTDVWYRRGAAGKFITVYPRDDDHFRRIACDLHEATAGLAGPEILSDLPYRKGSLVHYRYGVFGGERVFTDDGLWEYRLVGPDGSTVKDERNAWFSPPSWARAAFDGEVLDPAAVPESVVLGNRFSVTQAIRHANKGGVYRALDQRSGVDVIVKQARAHVGSRLDGRDVRDRLRDEARMLDLLAPLSVIPRKIDLFEEQGDLFLVQELVPGEPLSEWAGAHSIGGKLETEKALKIVQGLVKAVSAVHQAGYVLRDLKPQNVMVSTTDNIYLIDVEYVVVQGSDAATVGTLGFMAPEVGAGHEQNVVQAAEPATDCFGLGVTIFCALTALSPLLISGSPSRIVRASVLTDLAGTYPVLETFGDLVLGLTKLDPASRWSLDDAKRFVGGVGDPAHVREARSLLPSGPIRLNPDLLDRLIDDGLSDLTSRMTPDGPRLWPMEADPDGERDACVAWSGASGIVAVLARASAARPADVALRQSVSKAVGWIGERLLRVPRLLPGLAFGRSGTAWAVHDAATLIGDRNLADRAVHLARQLPTAGPNSDITHGLSGAGMAHVHLADMTGDDDLSQRVSRYAASVLSAAVLDGEDWSWPTARDADSKLAGTAVYGLAHGVAGTGLFLLGAGLTVTDRAANYLDAARGAGDSLLRAAGNRGASISWPRSIGSQEHGQPGQWCGGAAGIGTFLLRLWSHTEEGRYADGAERCAAAAMVDPWRLVVGACCGLAGVGQFLLDMADYTNDETYYDHAWRIAGIIGSQHHLVGSLQLVGSRGTGLGYAQGSAGVIAFLLRLRYGGPAPWLPRVLTTEPHRG